MDKIDLTSPHQLKALFHTLLPPVPSVIDTQARAKIQIALGDLVSALCSTVLLPENTPALEEYQPIETVPDNTLVFLAGWSGNSIIRDGEPYDQIGWEGEPKWVELIGSFRIDRSEKYDYGYFSYVSNPLEDGPFKERNQIKFWRPYNQINPVPHNFPIIPPPVIEKED